MSRIRVADLTDLPPGTLLSCRAGSTQLVLLNADGEVCAYEDRCAHLGVRLSEGTLAGTTLTCSAHAWCYHATSGASINPRGAQLVRVELEVHDGAVYVDPTAVPGRRAPPAVAEHSGVGPIFEAGATANAAIDAMRALGQNVTVLDRGSYLRVFAPRILRLTRAALEDKTKTLIFPRDVETIMVSFKGRISVSEEEIVWTLPGQAP